MHQFQWCFIDFADRNLRVQEYDPELLKEDLEHFGVDCASKLDCPDWRVFSTKSEAHNFLSDYKRTLAGLDNAKICKARGKGVGSMLYKRKYMVQTLMGVKNSTVRSYKKDWKPGKLFNLYDQTFFLTVMLKSIEELPEGGVKYNFVVPPPCFVWNGKESA